MQGTVSYKTGLLLSDILQLLCNSRQTGCLHLRRLDGGIPALINISAGTVLNAKYGNKQDEEAITEAMSYPEWEFELLPGLSESEGRIQETLSGLLLRCSIIADRVKQSVAESAAHDEWRPQLLEYTLNGGAVSGGFSQEDAEVLAGDLEFFGAAAKRLAEHLRESGVRELGVMESEQAMAFCFDSDRVVAVVGVNADMETTLARARKRMR